MGTEDTRPAPRTRPRAVTMRACRSTSSVARPPSPARSSCSSPSGPRSSSTAGCSRAARTNRSATGSRSPSTPATLDAVLLTHAHLDHCGLSRCWSRPATAARSTRPRARSSSRRSSCSTPASSTRSSPSARRAGRSATPTRSRPTTAAKPTNTRPPSTWPRPGRGGRDDRPAARRAAEAAEPSRPRRHRARRDDRRSRADPGDPRPPGRAIPRPTCAPSRRTSRSTSTRRCTRPRTPSARSPSSSPCTTARRSRSRPGIHATFVDAGHILGSAIIRLRVQDQDGGEERVIVFSGDLGRPGTPILRDPTPMTDADYVLVESTYGGREHEPEAEAIRILAETVRMVADAGGVLLVPSFAIGRTQEVVWELDRLIERGEIPLLPLYLDSPMASKASDIYRRHPDYYDEETAQAPARGRHAARLPEPDRHQRREVVAGDRARAAAVHDRRLERDADRRAGRRPPAQPHRRPERDDPVRRLPGRGHARRAPPGRRDGGQDRRPDAGGSLPDALDQRLLGARRRDASCSNGSATSPPASTPATPAIRAGSSSSTATRRPRSRSSRRSASSASRPTSRTGTSGSRSTRRERPMSTARAPR